jgi:hypothetical protein
LAELIEPLLIARQVIRDQFAILQNSRTSGPIGREAASQYD